VSGESRLPRTASVGGQAVLEGVMMRGADAWAVALRTPAGDVAVQRFPLPAWSRRRGLRLPLVRGVAALAEAAALGARAFAVSRAPGRPPSRRRARVLPAATLLAAALVLFFVAPAVATRLAGQGPLAEALLRFALLLGYLVALTLRRASRRLLEYHGAEHKAVACHEAGLPLTPEHAAGCARGHPRCGTSFAALVAIVAGIVVVPLGQPEWPWLVASRVLAAPVAAGLAFELVRGLARVRAQGLLAPLVALQRLSTREPDRPQLEVAIAALEAVLRVYPRTPHDRVAGGADRGTPRRGAGADVGPRGDRGPAALRRSRPPVQPARPGGTARGGVAPGAG